jgi:hypothetical protein
MPVQIQSAGIVEPQKLRCYNGIMTNQLFSFTSLNNELIASLAELDARRLYLGEGFPSMFAYCTQVLQ